MPETYVETYSETSDNWRDLLAECHNVRVIRSADTSRYVLQCMPKTAYNLMAKQIAENSPFRLERQFTCVESYTGKAALMAGLSDKMPDLMSSHSDLAKTFRRLLRLASENPKLWDQDFSLNRTTGALQNLQIIKRQDLFGEGK